MDLHTVSHTVSPEAIFTIVDLLGVFVASALGAEVAAAKGLDPVGFIALALVSGLGGGVVRDVLLAQGPPRALTHISYLLVALVAAMIAFLFNMQHRRAGRFLFTVLDALAVAFWAVAGSQRALGIGLSVLSAALVGVVTAVGGGVIRDVLVGDRPMVFVANGSLYATAAFAAASVNIALTLAVDVPQTVATFFAVTVGFSIRLLSLRYRWTLPAATIGIKRPRQ